MKKLSLFLVLFIAFAATLIAGCAKLANGFPTTGGETQSAESQNPPTEIYCVVSYSCGSVSFEESVKYGDFAESIIPEDTATHEFLYWTCNGEKYDFKTPVTGDIKLEASWEAKIFTVTFLHLGEVIKTCEYSGDDTEIAVPEFETGFGYRVRFSGDVLPNGGDIIVEVEYIAVPLKTILYADGEILRIEERTVEEVDCNLPQGYEWSAPELCSAETGEYIIIRGVKTTSPEVPAEPSEPTKPVKPTEPQPEEPVEPPKPDEPEIPTEPVESEKPNEEQTGKFSEWNVDFDNSLNGYVINGYLGTDTAITVPARMEDGKSVIKIGRNVFDGSSVTSVVISEGITVIGNGVFRSCASLTLVTLPSTLKEIGLEAFCFTPLENIDIPESVTKIGSNAFYRCLNLKAVNFPKLTELGDYAFAGCNGLEELDITDVETLGTGAFMACVKLKRVNLGDGVKTVGENAFKDCVSLLEVTFGKDVIQICSNAFAGCRSLLRATFLSTDGWKFYDKTQNTYNDLSAYIKNAEAMAGIISLNFAAHEFFKSPY